MGKQLRDPLAEGGDGRAWIEVRSSVQLTVENGRGILEPVRPTKITLEWIISETKRLGPENAPETVERGPDRGTERFYDYD
jgi:hypothetical protein